MRMESIEKLTLESEVYFKLREAEIKAEITNILIKRCFKSDERINFKS